MSDVKAQPIRLLDVLVIGPLIIAGGAVLAKRANVGLGTALIVTGFGTMAYNAVNFQKVERRRARSMRAFEFRPQRRR